jgi:hypothetical protein
MATSWVAMIAHYDLTGISQFPAAVYKERTPLRRSPLVPRLVPVTALFGPSIVRASSGTISLHPPHTNTRRTRTNLPGRRETRPQLVHNTVTLLTDIFFFLKRRAAVDRNANDVV